MFFFFFSSRRRHTRCSRDWSSDVCSSDLSTKARPSSATWRRRDMPEPMGFFTDTTVCIGCKACEVACKEWNQLPAENGGVRGLGGDSSDHTPPAHGLPLRGRQVLWPFTRPCPG